MSSSNNTGTGPSTTLGKLPIPELDDTVARFATVVRPLFGDNEFEACLGKMKEFVATQGPVLQERLRKRSAEHENWMEEWWNEYAYFLNRASICFNVNYFFGFRDTPQQLRQTQLAAVLIESAMRFREQLESDNFETDNIRGKPMCMHQYQYMFGTCRHPGKTRDWTEVYSRDESGHVAVAYGGRFFTVQVPTGGNRKATIAQLERQLQAIINTSTPVERSHAIGVLTAATRDDWYAGRESLLQAAPANADRLRQLESAAFLVSLETSAPTTHEEFSLACHCGDGASRYFDKNFQVLVFANGRYGFNGEHSLTDATTDMRLCNAMVQDAEAAASEDYAETDTAVSGLEPQTTELAFELSDVVREHIARAVDYFDATVAAHELSTLAFDGFGKEQVKKLGVSPDAFVQMAMQLAYYRQFRHVPATYESASTKAFARGRTETSRSVSEHSVAWCRAMVDEPEQTGLQAKAAQLREAIAHQARFTAQCARGSGIDRHLLGLEYALLPHEPRPAVFDDAVFAASRHWRLSTSQISDPILAAYGWGEVVDDGFGVAYRIEGDALHFNVVSQRMGSERLCRYLADALTDMRFLLANAHRQPHEIRAEVDAVANVLASIKLLSASPRRPLSPASEAACVSSSESGSASVSEPASAALAPTSPADAHPFRVSAAGEAAVARAVAGELDRLPSNEIICALEMRLSRFVRESLSWALPSAT
ncbi:Carnitine O-acetyltransferase mitochondrial [Coemansia sp. RSA 1365]|nr:Carnitine O-acetyltransferase mitochondrial [Coemansia sp. RSA 1365]